MAAGGAVAIWHDIVPEGLAEFYAWHGEEHMPERVGIPGFVRGRRYVALEASLGFFNLYETASADVVAGPEYRARLDSPTPRTLSAVRHFRNVARSLCRVTARTGTAQGGVVATLRYEVPEHSEIEHVRMVTGQTLPRLAAAPGVANVMLLEADRQASGYVNAEQRARGAANAVPPYVLVCEGWAGEEEFLALVRDALGPRGQSALGIAEGAALDVYRHQLTVVKDDA
ncbi:hypothetical protein [Alsobacter sp. R-9]